MAAALTRYRAIAYLVGAVLVVLVVIGMPMKYLADDATIVETVGPAHGFLYMVLLVAIFDLSRRMGWGFGKMAGIMLAGTVPFLSFWMERRVRREVRAELSAQAFDPVADSRETDPAPTDEPLTTS